MFFWARDGLMAVEVKSGASFAVGLPHQLFGRQPCNIDWRVHDASADSQHFLIYAEKSASVSIIVTPGNGPLDSPDLDDRFLHRLVAEHQRKICQKSKSRTIHQVLKTSFARTFLN